MAKRMFIFSLVIILLAAVSATTAQNSPLTNIVILLEQAQAEIVTDDLTTAQAFVSGANALLSPDVIAECDSLPEAKTLLIQLLETSAVEEAMSSLAGAQALLSECDQDVAEGDTLELAETYESEFLSFDYPDGWVLGENIRMDEDVITSAYITVAESQAVIDAFPAGNPGDAIFLTVDTISLPLITDPTDIDEVAEFYPHILGIANFEYTLDIVEAEVAGQDARIVSITLESDQETGLWGDKLTSIIMLESGAENAYVVGVTKFNFADSDADDLELSRQILASANFSPDGGITPQ